MKTIRITIAALVSAGLLAACSSGSHGSSTSSSSSSSAAVNGKTFTYLSSTDLGSLNPYKTTIGATNQFDSYLYGTLILADGKGNLLPVLAQKWTATTTTASFTLRPGLTCSDGTPLTASDVAADINYVGDPKNASTDLNFLVTAGSQATGDDTTRTVNVTSGKSDPFLLNDLGSLGIVCKAGLSDPALLDAGKASSGPYQISGVAPGDHYTATLRKDFNAGAGTWTASKPGVPQEVTARVVANSTTAANLFLSGQLNSAFASGPDAQRMAATHPQTYNSYSVLDFYFNQLPGQPGADLAVRQALFAALDLGQIRKVLGDGKPLLQIGGWNPTNPCPGNTVGNSIPATDVSRAGQLLTSAGWVPGSDGIRSKDGKRLTMNYTYWASPGNAAAAAELIQQELKAVGVEVTLKLVDANSSNATMKSGDWGLAMTGWGFVRPNQMIPFFSGKAWTDGGTNFTAINNTAYTTLAAQASTLAGSAGCAIWNQAEEALIKSLDFVPVYELASPTFTRGVDENYDLGVYGLTMTK